MTTIQDRLASFRPVATEEALKSVRRAHPIAGSITPLPETGILERVRQKLQNTTDSDLNQLAFDFPPIELRACLRLLCTAEEPILHERAAAVILIRSRPDLLQPAWTLLVNSYPVRRLEEVVGALGTTHSWHGLAPRPRGRNSL